MRILIETMSYPPNVSGVAVFVEQLATYLEKQGHEVHIVTPSRSFRSSVTCQGTITIHWLRSYPNFWRKGFRLPFMTTLLARRLVSQIRPDAIHINDPLGFSRDFVNAGRLLGARTIVSHHFNLDYVLFYVPKLAHPIVRAYLKAIMSRVYNRCSVVVAPSQSVASSIPKSFKVKSPVVAVSNGVDLHRFYSYFPLEPFRAKYRLPHKKLLLYVGRLDKDKSLAVLFKAMERVAPEKGAHLVVVGAGNQEKYLRKLTARNLVGSVSFIGWVDHQSQDLLALFQLCDIFVIPSSIETQSISTLEAMASGKPVVAANGGALPELVKHNQNGFLFTPGNSDELAEYLLSLLAEPSLQASFGRQSLVMIADHELDSSLGVYEKLYKHNSD